MADNRPGHPNPAAETDYATARRDPLGPDYDTKPKRAALHIVIAVGVAVAMLAILIVAFFTLLA